MIENKKILITQNSLFQFTGSEIVTLELALFLQSHNNEVLIFTWVLDEPMRTFLKQNHITVITDDNDERLSNFDYIWVHHQVLPQCIIKNMPHSKTKKPKFIFYHMSAMENSILEHPYVFNLENSLSDFTAFVSQESHDSLIKLYPSLKHNSNHILSNWAPTEYLINSSQHKSPLNIAIISNHVPDELRIVANLLKRRDINVIFFGLADKVQKITPQLLQNFDVVITIGKTVQYCLAMGLPVYVYDRFGGPGYLNNKNFSKSLYYNFSGRGFQKKTAKKIVEELLNRYSQSISYYKKNQSKFQHLFSINNLLENVFENISKEHTLNTWTEEYRKYVSCAEEFAAKSVKPIIVYDHTKINQLEGELLSAQQKLAEAQGNLNKIESSRLIKTARKIRKIPTKINTMFQTANNRIPKIFRDQKAAYSLSKSANLSALYYEKVKSGDYKIELLQKKRKVPIIGMIMERNEHLILDDTLSEMEKIVDGFVLLDDKSDDNSLKIAKTHKKCLAVIRHKKWTTGNRSSDESIHRQFLLDTARYFSPEWLFYQDADERIDGDIRSFMQKNTKNDQILGLRLSLFDAYMTNDCQKPYISGQLYNFRKMFGPERRDIIMAWKDSPSIDYLIGEDAREPYGLDDDKIITKFYIQHYGKSLSIEHWEETCSYYELHFPQYAEKWKNRHGKAIHTKSDFGRKLLSWENVKKSGGIKIN